MDTQSLRLAFLKQRGWKPRQVLDIGAHKGAWALAFCSVFPTARIFMIEADERHRPFLDAAGFPYQIGLVGRSATMVPFHTLENAELSQGASIYRENTAIYNQTGLTLTVPMSRLDDLVEEVGLADVNFIKLDVQGAEIDVLEGAHHLLATHPVDFVLAELSLIRFNEGAPLADEVIAYMRGHGFGLHDIFELHYWNDQLIQIDVLFARDRLLTSELLVQRSGH